MSFSAAGRSSKAAPKVGQAVPLPGLSFKDIGREFLCRNGRIYLPSGENVTGLLQVDVEDVPLFARTSKVVQRPDSGGDGPRLLQGDFDTVFKAVATPQRDGSASAGAVFMPKPGKAQANPANPNSGFPRTPAKDP